MTDIEERLHEMAKDMIGPYEPLTLEAADEIRRLRGLIVTQFDETVKRAKLQAENERLRAERDQWRADYHALRDGKKRT